MTQESKEEGQIAPGAAKEADSRSWLGEVEKEIVEIEHEIVEIAHQPPERLLRRALILDLPYIVMLSIAAIGIGLVTYFGDTFPYFWEFLTPVFAGICIYAGWRHTETQEERVRLVVTQALHWTAVLISMYLVQDRLVRDVVNNNATGLTLMTMLALATFLAGVHAEAWQICIVGAILALAVPAMAWIQQSALFLVILALGVVFVAGSLWLTFHREKKRITT